MLSAAVAKEAENQREELKNQRKSYISKVNVLKLELDMLKEHRKDMGVSNGPVSPRTKGFIDENEKLQVCVMFNSRFRVLNFFVALWYCRSIY